MSRNQNQNQDTYANLTMTGMGYINRPRWVQPDEGDAYLSMSINAWHGKNGKKSTLIETSPRGEQANRVIDELLTAYPELMEGGRENHGLNVTIGFMVGDCEPKSFVSRDKKTTHYIKSRLFLVNWIKVNGQYFYRKNDGKAEAHEEIPAMDAGENHQQPEPPKARPAPVRQPAQPQGGQQGQNRRYPQ